MERVATLDTESRLIVDTIPGLVALLSPTGAVDVVNRQLLDYFGQTLEELRDWGTNGTVHPEDLPHVADNFSRSIANGIPYEIVQRLRRGDGVYRWMQNSGFPLRGENGEIRRWCVLLTDIHERKTAEEALMARERDLKLIIDTIPALAWSARPDGSADFFNLHYLDYLGLSAEEARGYGWTKAVHPDDRETLSIAWQRILASGRLGEAEARLRRHDGEYRWFLFRANPLRDESGNVVRWYGTNIDIEDRKRGELKLRESELQFKTIFDEAGTGISMVDLIAGEPIRNNRALQTMLGCTEEELSRFETYDRLTHESARGKDARTFRDICDGSRDTLRIEKHFVLDDGRAIWANVIFTLLRDQDRRPRYVIAIHEDITERKLAIEELQAKQDLLELAQKAAGAIAFDWHIQQEINEWSPEQEALYGLSPGTFDGTYQGWKKLIYPYDWPALTESIRHAQETGQVTAEFRVLWPDGTVHWLATNGEMFFDDEGKPLRMVGFTSDITRRKLIEDDLRRSEAFLAEGQYLARMGNFAWRVATEEITWSEPLYRIFEFEPGTPMTLDRIATRVYPDDMPLLFDMVERAQRGVTDFSYEHRLLMPDGSIKFLHLIAHGNRDQQGSMEYIGAVQDVTERHRSEAALSQARSELARAARVMSLGVLTASIAHEVNQPLSGIITNANTCVRMLDSDPPNIEGALTTARRTIRDGNRASDVITRLRALFSRKDFTVESVDLNEAAQEVIALSRAELQRSQVILRTQFAKDLPPVDADRVQLQQVILNLLLNAADAMSGVDDRPRSATIATGSDGGDRVRLSVRDVGVGFAPGTADKLFEAFYTTKQSGMGIGLSVSRSIIEAHHGRLWAEPNAGEGAVFAFSLPIGGSSGLL
jgi:PAS domain S-box-containing protein